MEKTRPKKLQIIKLTCYGYIQVYKTQNYECFCTENIFKAYGKVNLPQDIQTSGGIKPVFLISVLREQ